jgi:hypothetical protein
MVPRCCCVFIHSHTTQSVSQHAGQKHEGDSHIRMYGQCCMIVLPVVRVCVMVKYLLLCRRTVYSGGQSQRQCGGTNRTSKSRLDLAPTALC